MSNNESELSEREMLIREKMRAGLSRAQAEQVLQSQDEHDANLAAQAKKTKRNGKDGAEATSS